MPRPKKITRLSVLVYPRYGKPKGTQHYDAKWLRAANEVAAHPTWAMVVVGQRGKTSKKDLELLKKAKAKLGNRLIVINEDMVNKVRRIIERRGMEVASGAKLVGMGQHYSEYKGHFCIESIGKGVIVTNFPTMKFRIDKQRSLRDTKDLLHAEMMKIFPKWKKDPFYTRGGHDLESDLGRLGTFIERGLIKYSTVLGILKRRKALLPTIVEAENLVEKRLMDDKFNSRLSNAELDSFIELCWTHTLSKAGGKLKKLRGERAP